ncbi:TPA: hypothetical protein N0F65_011035, partial [Lagenidium giganteum]
MRTWFVQHAYAGSETRPNLMFCLNAFTKNNPAHDETRAIIVGKNMTEIGVLQDAFPSAGVLTCWFHVLKHFKGQKYAQMAEVLYSCHICQFMIMYAHKLVYASSEADFLETRNAIIAQLRVSSKTEPMILHPFEEYFMKKWDACRDMWVKFARDDDVVRLGNNTNFATALVYREYEHAQ